MICAFCNNEIHIGTGMLFVERDGTTIALCSRKCKVNLLKLKREGRLEKWTNKALVTRTGKAGSDDKDKKKSELTEGIDKMLAEKRAKEAAEKTKK